MQKVLPTSGRSQECPSEKGFLEKSALEMGPEGFVSGVRGKELRQQDQNKEIYGKQKSTKLLGEERVLWSAWQTGI